MTCVDSLILSVCWGAAWWRSVGLSWLTRRITAHHRNFEALEAVDAEQASWKSMRSRLPRESRQVACRSRLGSHATQESSRCALSGLCRRHDTEQFHYDAIPGIRYARRADRTVSQIFGACTSSPTDGIDTVCSYRTVRTPWPRFCVTSVAS